MNIRSAVTTFGITTTMAVVGLGFGVPAIAAPSAPAAAGSDCSNNTTCIYAGGVNHDGGSYNTKLGYRSPNTALANISTANRNRLSSWINKSNVGARFYYDTNGNGTCVSMYSNDMASASASNPDDNEAESHAYTRTC
jgi:hypothetical protein